MPTSTPTSARTGPFWDAMHGRAPLPRAAAILGLEVLDADPDAGRLELAFAATEDFTTPFGEVLGGFLAAMLYDTVGPTLLATLEPHQFIETLDLNARFLRPAHPGRLLATGRIVHRDGELAYLEAALRNASGLLLATGTATLRVVERTPPT